MFVLCLIKYVLLVPNLVYTVYVVDGYDAYASGVAGFLSLSTSSSILQSVASSGGVPTPLTTTVDINVTSWVATPGLSELFQLASAIRLGLTLITSQPQPNSRHRRSTRRLRSISTCTLLDVLSSKITRQQKLQGMGNYWKSRGYPRDPRTLHHTSDPHRPPLSKRTGTT